MEFRILGPIEVRVGGRPLPLGGPKQRLLLALLALRANRVVSVDRLVDALWGDAPPATATAQVHGYVSTLRRILDTGGAGREVLVTRPPGYVLCLGLGQLDLVEFDRCVEQAREARDAGRLREFGDGLRTALAVWRGPALDGVSGRLMAAEATRLEERRLAMLEERIEADLALGDSAELVAELTALVAEQPLRERVRGQLMVALYRAGRQVDALAVYRQARQALAEELGLDPGPELQALERKILTGDPSLLLAQDAAIRVMQHLPAVPVSAEPPLQPTDRMTSVQMGQPDPVLLWAKLQPPVGRKVIPRRALVDLLCTAEPRKLALIRAPAGWGKTTLLADWHASARETRPFAWLALDRDDNDPLRFWTYLIEALRTLDPELGINSRGLLRAPGVNLVTGVLPVLINELVISGKPSVLVLDDYHLIEDAGINEGIAFLIEHLPPTLELAISTRCEPVLPLARLRVRRESVEIDAAALRFSPEEATALLNGLHGLTLSRNEVDRLCERTEGWAAGLYLATLTLRGRDDVHEFLGSFTGNHHHIVDYLGGEVLADQPEEIRDFLLRTSILDRLCAPLCDAVTGTVDSTRTLMELEGSNFFLVPLDPQRRWYRYHHLFGELLRRELDLTEPGLVPKLHCRASAWHLQANLIAEAIRHAIAAGDLPHAGELIATHWIGFVHDGKFGTVDAWLQALGDPFLLSDARMCLARAWTSFAMARLADVLPWTEAAQTAPLPAPIRDGTTSTAAGAANLRASYWLVVGNLGRVRHFAMAAIELEKDPGWLAVATNCAGMACYWLGDIAAAEAHLEQTVRHPELMPLVVVHALGHLAMIHAEQNDWDRAEERATAAIDLANRHGTSEYWVNAMAHITRAKVLHHRSRLADAEGAVLRGLELAARGSNPMDVTYGLMILAQARHGLGDLEEAWKLLCRARSTLAGCPDPGLLPALIESVNRRLLAGSATDTS